MQFVAKVKYVRCSPYKLRPLANVVRGKLAAYAHGWLTTCAMKRAVPMKKMLDSALANAKSLALRNPEDLVIKEIRVDQGPIYRYFKPGAQGRSNIYRKRFSHLSIVLVDKKEA